MLSFSSVVFIEISLINNKAKKTIHHLLNIIANIVKQTTDAILYKTNEIMDLWRDFITVVCNECGKKIILKKESNYAVCPKCKSTILIDKDVVGNVPYEYSNLTPKEYNLLLENDYSKIQEYPIY